MRTNLQFLFGLIAVSFFLAHETTAQNYQLGTGTATNGTTTASPVNIWYRRTVCQTVYTAFELNAAGASGPCTINGLGWYVTNVPLHTMPGYTIKIKHTNQADVATAIPTGGWTTVVNAFNYAPTAGGYDMLNFNTAFNWNGVDNIAIEICWAQVQPDYDASGQCRTYNQASGFRYSRTDVAGNSCGDVPGSILGWKPQVQFSTNCAPDPCAPLNASSPVTTDDNVCAGDAATLTAAANHGGTLNWYDAVTGGNLVHTGTSYTFTPGASTSFWVEESDGGSCVSLRSQVDADVAPVMTNPVMTDGHTCLGGTVTLTAASTSGAANPVLNWYDAPVGGNLLGAGTSYSYVPPTNQTFWVEEVGAPTSGTLMDVGAQESSFTGMSRGYYFTAPTNFTITGVRVPTDQSTDDQSVEIVRFTAGAPPLYTATTNSFVSLFRAADVAGTAIIPCNVTVAAGDIIGIVGSRGANSVNSYGASGGQNTTIAGMPVTLTRCGMQDDLEANPLHDIWSENGRIGRVEMYYDAAGGCSSNRMPVNAVVADPAYAPTNVSTVANTTCVVNEGGVDWTYYYNSASPEDLLFAIAHDPNGLGNNTFTAAVDVTVTANPTDPSNFTNGIFKAEDIPNQEAYFAMGRYWNVTTTGALVDPVNIRFYYDPNERAAVETAANTWMTTHNNSPQSLAINPVEWFKTNGVPYVPANILTPNTLVNSLDYTAAATAGLTTPSGVNYVQINGVTSFSGGTLAVRVVPDPLLASKLSSFVATKFEEEDAKLVWSTESEEGLVAFEVQRSSDGSNFETIGTVQAIGGLNQTTYYEWLDTEPYEGTNYYRLKLINADGTNDLSVVRVLTFSEDWGNVQVMPNPFEDHLTVRVEAPEADLIEVALFNSLGQRVLKRSFDVKAGMNEMTLDWDTELPRGSYLITIQNDKHTTHRKLIKK